MNGPTGASSSIRAQSDMHADHILSEADAAQPTEPYGRSKLAAENAVRAADLPYTILRPVLVYSRDARGNLASLIRLARSALPLPFGAINNRRSLLAVENLIAAIEFVLADARARNETFIVADPQAVAVGAQGTEQLPVEAIPEVIQRQSHAGNSVGAPEPPRPRRQAPLSANWRKYITGSGGVNAGRTETT